MPIPDVRVRALTIITVAFLCTGCQNMGHVETAWQTLHLVDVAQTYNATRDPCYRESDPITSSLIGERPSSAEVLAWGLGTAALHAFVSRTLEKREAPRWVRTTWNVLTIGQTSITVANNHGEGVRPFGPNEPVPGCSPRL